MAERPNIEVRVLPLDPGAHLAAFGAFTLLTAPGATDPYMAVQTDWGSAHYLDRPDVVASYVRLSAQLEAVALSQADSIDLCRSTAQEFRP